MPRPRTGIERYDPGGLLERRRSRLSTALRLERLVTNVAEPDTSSHRLPSVPERGNVNSCSPVDLTPSSERTGWRYYLRAIVLV